eukprot:UN10811
MISMSQETTAQIIAEGAESGSMDMSTNDPNVTDFGNIEFDNDNNAEQEDDDETDDGLYTVNNVTTIGNTIGNIEDIDDNILNEEGSDSNELYNNKNINITATTPDVHCQGQV